MTDPGTAGHVEAPPVDVLDSSEAGPKAIRGGVFRVGAYGINLLLSLVAIPPMIRHLGVVDYGYYVTAGAVITIVAGLTEAGMTSIALREYAQRDTGERLAVLRNVVGLRVVLTIATVAIAALAFTAVGEKDAIVAGILILGFGLLVQIVAETYLVPFQVDLRLGVTSALDVLGQLVRTGTIIALVVVGASLLPFFWVTAIAAGMTLAVTITMFRRRVSLRPTFDVGEWKAFLRDALPYAAASAVGMVYFRAAVVLMSLIATSRQTGYYSAAFRIVEILAGIPWLLITAAFPILARAARDDHRRLAYGLERLFETGVIVGVWMAMSTWIGARFAIAVVAGPHFKPSVDVLRIQGLALIATFLLSTWAYGLLSLKRHRAILIANALALAVAVGATYAFVPLIAARGAAVASTAAEFTLAGAYVVALMRRRRDLRPRLAVVPRVAVATLLAGAVAYVTPLPDVALVALSTVVYAAVLLALRAIPAELLDALRGLRR